MKIYNFDTNKIILKKKFQRIFEIENLELIHKKYTYDNNKELFNKYNDNQTYIHKLFFEKIELFLPLYQNLIGYIKNNIYKQEEFIVYQKIPALRVSLPGNVSVGEIHCDYDYNHPENEMNYWLPITETNEINTIWHESEPNKDDFTPLLINYGEIAEVYFNKCRHFSKVNTSDKTRLSLDFRIIPGSKWNNNDDTYSMFNNIRFTIGNYYEKYQ